MTKLISQIRKYSKLRSQLEKLGQGDSTNQCEDLRRRCLATERSIREQIEKLLTVGHERELLRTLTSAEPPEAWWPIECFAELI